MHKELINMINSNNITVRKFFTMNPFSSLTNKQYKKFSNEINFFDDMNVISTKTIERLATLAKVSIDDSFNTLIVTGYSGSGKTNFLRFCEAIITGKTIIKDYEEIRKEIEELYELQDNSLGKASGENLPDFFSENNVEHDINELVKLRFSFKNSLSKIKTILYTDYFEKNTNEIEKVISKDLNHILKGESIYFDFDAGKRDDIEPLEIKLTRHIEGHLKQINYEKVKKLGEFYRVNEAEFSNAFENRSQYLFSDALKFICENKNDNFDEYKVLLSQKLQDLEIDQLLCIEVLLKILELLDSDFEGYIYYFLDNIDMVSGQTNDVLRKTIAKFWDFTSEMQSLMDELREKNSPQNRKWIELGDQFKYIFAMRETTAMHISDHLRGRIDAYSKHFDISHDINKSFIFKKRYNILKQHIDKREIYNVSFIKIVNCIEYITEDKYYKWNLFSLFNNDYRKTINCLCQICSKEESPMYQSTSFLKSHQAYYKFGGRGIIIRTICDSFKNWGYFSNLKITTREKRYKDSEYNITLMRKILTVLFNMQNKISTNEEIPFFVDREQSVSIKQLYDKVELFCKNKDNFLKCIEKMFSCRTWNYWNHLITFDNILEYSEVELLKALNDTSGNYNIYIRCTNAGEKYLNTICVHYEFFSCRFASSDMSLFDSKSYSFKNGKYLFQNQVQQVLQKVKDCCNELKLVNSKLLEYLELEDYADIIDEQIYVKDKKFHEERIIHNHISYLDAFRLYLINGPLKEKVCDINKIIIGYIKEYLELLKYEENLFYSENSERLYKELTGCIKAITTNDYIDTEIVISRDYFKKHLNK